MDRSEEHTSELQSPCNLVCRLLLEKKKKRQTTRRENLVQTHLIDYRTDSHCTTALASCVGCSAAKNKASAPSLPPFFFFNDTATTEIYTLSLHDALPI